MRGTHWDDKIGIGPEVSPWEATNYDPTTKPFSNGTEYHWFLDNYCYQCYRYHEDEEGFPTKNSCKVEKAIALYQFDDSQKWPDEIVQTGKKYHHCVLFCNKDDFVRAKPQRKPMIGQMALEEQEDG